MRRMLWRMGLVCGLLMAGCKEPPPASLPSGGGLPDSTTSTNRGEVPPAASPAVASDSHPHSPASPLLEKPVVVESGKFEVRQDGNKVSLPGFQISLPEGWSVQKDAPSPRLVNWITPEGLVIGIFWFGASGGSVEDNLKRWEGQFSQLTSREVTKDTLHAPRVTQARWQGVYAGDNGMNPGRPNETSVMLVAVVEGARGSVFFKTVGSVSQTNAARGLLRQAIRELVPQP